MKPVRKNKVGMTLVEVLAVVVLLGILAATLAIGFSGSFGKAKQEIARTAIAQLQQKLELYRLEVGQWPTLDLGLMALTEGHASPADPFFVEPDKLTDPWTRPFHYVTPGPRGHPYEILSYGADGQVSGSGEDADISSVHLKSR